MPGDHLSTGVGLVASVSAFAVAFPAFVTHEKQKFASTCARSAKTIRPNRKHEKPNLLGWNQTRLRRNQDHRWCGAME